MGGGVRFLSLLFFFFFGGGGGPLSMAMKYLYLQLRFLSQGNSLLILGVRLRIMQIRSRLSISFTECAIVKVYSNAVIPA